MTKTQNITIKGYKFKIFKNNIYKFWTGSNNKLKIMAQGRTKKELIDILKNITILHLEGYKLLKKKPP